MQTLAVRNKSRVAYVREAYIASQLRWGVRSDTARRSFRRILRRLVEGQSLSRIGRATGTSRAVMSNHYGRYFADLFEVTGRERYIQVRPTLSESMLRRKFEERCFKVWPAVGSVVHAARMRGIKAVVNGSTASNIVELEGKRCMVISTRTTFLSRPDAPSKYLHFWLATQKVKSCGLVALVDLRGRTGFYFVPSKVILAACKSANSHISLYVPVGKRRAWGGHGKKIKLELLDYRGAWPLVQRTI